MRNNAAYLPESPIVYIILPKSIRNRASLAIFVKMKTADGTFGYGHCRDMEDSYSAWKQAEIDIYIYTFTERLGIEN